MTIRPLGGDLAHLDCWPFSATLISPHTHLRISPSLSSEISDADASCMTTPGRLMGRTRHSEATLSGGDCACTPPIWGFQIPDLSLQSQAQILSVFSSSDAFFSPSCGWCRSIFSWALPNSLQLWGFPPPVLQTTFLNALCCSFFPPGRPISSGCRNPNSFKQLACHSCLGGGRYLHLNHLWLGQW